MSGSQQQLLGYGASAYRIANSLRFRSSASAYLNRTPASAGNQKTWTWSGWVKRGKPPADATLFQAFSAGGSYLWFIFSGDNLYLQQNPSSTIELLTTQVFRDYSAWYHIVLAVDTTQATASNRLKLYVNGQQVTAFSTATYPAQNSTTFVNQAISHNMGANEGTGGSHNALFDGYMADINFIDGQALDPTSFGSFNATTGVWGPKSYAGTYGTNGFHLNFSNGTSTTTLGYDSSGNGNNWTTNNVSLTAGSTYDWMLDSPTPYQGSSYGVGNYCVLNPLDKGANITAANGNLNATNSTAAFQNIRGTLGVISGKWYWEQTVSWSSGAPVSVGIAKYTFLITNGSGTTSDSYVYLSNGNKYTNNVSSAYGASYASGDNIGVALDMDGGTVTFYKNGASQGTAFSSLTGTLFPLSSIYGTQGGQIDANFGQRPFAYTPPSGYKSLCTYNLPTPTIQNGAGYMAATLYTGTLLSNAVSNSVNGVSFQPDFVWIKSRSAATDHKLTDSVRGTTKALVSDSTAAETTDSQGLTAFGSSGFTVGTDTTYNNLAATYVGWQWKAGGTAVTNTAGSITSSVSANTTSGFSVVTYTGTGVNATVGHGLGVAPAMIIVKNRGNAGSWWVYSNQLTSAAYTLRLNATLAQTSVPGIFNSTAPTSSVFSVGTSGDVNDPSGTYVAYCFAAIPGYSAFGSYTGNGSTDGPFTYLGFRPRYILIKRTDTTASWYVHDTSRSPYNAMDNVLYPNLSNAEGTWSGSGYQGPDALSNGFKLRNNYSEINASGGTYVYACFAENPFTNALAR